MGHLLYFAYDQWMDEALLLESFPGSELFGAARLPGYAPGFDERGDFVLTPKPDGVTWGLLWMVPAVSMEALDRVNAAPRDTLRIISPAGPALQALCYHRGGGEARRAPRLSDWPLMMKAGRARRFPNDYLRTLETLAVEAARLSR